MLIDAFDRPHPEASIGTRWEFVTDGVMGGVSRGTMERVEIAGRPALRLTGRVSLENNGGFVQAALDLAPGGGPLDLSDHAGIEIDVTGNGETYGLHLRTTDVARPWQSWRASFAAEPGWRRIRFAFNQFDAHRIDAPLRSGRLRRVGIVAIGRVFEADVAVGRIAAFA